MTSYRGGELIFGISGSVFPLRNNRDSARKGLILLRADEPCDTQEFGVSSPTAQGHRREVGTTRPGRKWSNRRSYIGKEMFFGVFGTVFIRATDRDSARNRLLLARTPKNAVFGPCGD